MPDSVLYAALAVLAVAVAVLLKSLARAEARALARTRELEEARRHEALATLAGGIAHDFNNILGSVLGFGALLEDDLIAYPDQRALAQQIVIAARRGQGIVAQLMNYSKRHLRDDAQGRAPVSLDAVIRENIALLRPSIRSSTHVAYENHAARETISGAATQIGQAVMNLCINADHAIGVKTGAIEITLDNVDVKSPSASGLRVTGGADAEDPVVILNGALRRGPYVRIAVKDNGEGMTRAVAERIFEPFFTTKGVDTGTGLGLPAIEGIVHSHGGAVAVRTQR